MSNFKYELQRSGVTIAYSPREQKMFEHLKALGAARKEVSSLDVLEGWYNGADARPYHAREIVNNVIRSLTAKMAANGERVEIVKSPRAGPKHIAFKLSRKK